jgi:hypothetical protein
LAAPPTYSGTLISVEAKARPLGEVVGQISRDSGFMFQMDDAWRSHPVTVSIANTPLELGLKRILTGLNHAVLFRPGSTIQIVVIDAARATRDAPPGQTPAGIGAQRPSLRNPIDRGPRITLPAPPPGGPPAPALNEDGDDAPDAPPPAADPAPQPPKD